MTFLRLFSLRPDTTCRSALCRLVMSSRSVISWQTTAKLKFQFYYHHKSRRRLMRSLWAKPKTDG
jgi:hypothetical protein